MPVKFNTEFNYRYQVVGETVWEKIKTLQGFLEGRQRALRLEEVGIIKGKAKRARLQYLIDNKAPEHEILEMEAECLEYEHFGDMSYAYELNRQEIEILEIVAACTYATSANSIYQIEGRRCVDLRDAVWATLSTIFAAVDANQREMVSNIHELDAELPELTWD